MHVVLITNSRTESEFGRISIFWYALVSAAIAMAEKLGIKLTVLSPRRNYNDVGEFWELVLRAKENPDCDCLIMPFMAGSPELVGLINQLTCKLIIINTPPTPYWNMQITKPYLYVGSSGEKIMGELAAEKILEFDPNEVAIIKHLEIHEGLSQRILEIEKILYSKGVSVSVIPCYNDEDRDIGIKHIISLGPVGSAYALRNAKNPVIVAMDKSDDACESLKEHGAVKAIIFQDPEDQGRKAIEATLGGEGSTIYPRVITA